MEMKNPHVIWATVIIVIVLVGTMTTLIILDKDVAQLLALIAVVVLPVLTGFGVMLTQKMDQVKDTVNGNKNKDNQMIIELQNTVKELALRVPVQPEESPVSPSPDATLVLPRVEENWQRR